MNLSRLNSFLNWSMRVCNLFGIPVYLHISILFFLWPVLLQTSGLGIALAVEYSIAVVICILLHELGHALMSKRFKLTGLSITLHGFGGFASSSGWGSAYQELYIALAGPAVTFAIGIGCSLIASAELSRLPLTPENVGTAYQLLLLKDLGVLNIWMGCLNLIPSFPWDGGLTLQAILWFRMELNKATRAVKHLGLIVSTPIFVYGFIANQPFLGLFGLVGGLVSYYTLRNSGGIKFGEFFADRKARKLDEEARRRATARQEAYVSDVQDRQREREEKERLRKLFEKSGIDE